MVPTAERRDLHAAAPEIAIFHWLIRAVSGSRLQRALPSPVCIRAFLRLRLRCRTAARHFLGRSSSHGSAGDEIRRNVGRRYRPHPQRRAPRQARGRRRPRGRRGGLRHGRQDQRAGRLVPRGRAAARRARIRRRGRLRRAGHRRAARDHARRHGRQRALLAGLAAADPDHATRTARRASSTSTAPS